MPHRGPLVGGDEPGSSALSPDIHTQWVHSHTSDGVADLGMGAQVVPPPVGGPQNCHMVHLMLVLLVFLLCFCDLLPQFLDFDVFGSPRADTAFLLSL